MGADMNEAYEGLGEQSAAFQKLWTETLIKTMQAAWTAAPNAPPAEILREMRAGLMEGLAQSWDRFMRSPEFLDLMRQWLEQVVSFRKISNDLVGKVRNELQAPSAEDIENIVVAVRHMENRVLDRLADLAAQLERANPNRAVRRQQGAKTRAAGGTPARKGARRGQAKGLPGKVKASKRAKAEG